MLAMVFSLIYLVGLLLFSTLELHYTLHRHNPLLVEDVYVYICYPPYINSACILVITRNPLVPCLYLVITSYFANQHV